MPNLPKTIPPVSLAVAAVILRDTPAYLNDLIAKEIYPCAPHTTAGKRRVLDEVDVLGLRVFSHLAGSNTCSNQREAGKMACSVVHWMRSPMPAGSALHRVVFPTNWSYPHGVPVYKAEDGTLVGYDGEAPKDEETYGGRSATTVYVSLSLEDIRCIFRQKIEDGTLFIPSEGIIKINDASGSEAE
ncbi:hypothetical protein AD947_08805 [Acetobacter tropicalis]|uniref:Uncharacterized protein n=1 Tax=Acetobacter tropicalis TaxID=104102 RepID=A0A149TVT0_9PROT|nr:hypothetical protein [Acetobacter tropicalis]KXV57325.1 hypothetical protein AD947_08805 [Acetobacter tropicalis]